MISRPLDLASKLRRPPRNFDALFFVNGGLIVLYFFLFGSRFVLAPALGVDFRLPQMRGALAGARAPTHTISLTAAGQIFTPEGLLKMDELRVWLREQAKTTKEPVLHIVGDERVQLAQLTEITSAAYDAGFVAVMSGADEPASGGKTRAAGR
ncbi:MAG TPA: biopolymer transporter ExbD [Opitutaceae bacterium]|nr:biopolymer transporter ExbD [Opitutaceae bacterium]